MNDATMLLFVDTCLIALQASQSGYTLDYATQGAQAGFPGSFLNQNSQAGCTRFGTGNNLMP